MSPRGTSSPYSRRPASHPKSSRQQFSACGACRMRRVRCDLKDLATSNSSPSPCSNCKERGLNCVDEYAEVKAAKLLRRGRRLQQVEAIYGKVRNSDGTSFSSRPSGHIPPLKLEFFSSPFWEWFCIQRPVLDPEEFSQRYLAHLEGSCPLEHEGRLLSMVLVLWAASFGVDESGAPIESDRNDKEDFQAADQVIDPRKSSHGSPSHHGSPDDLAQGGRKRRRGKFNLMLQEILELIDFHGIMRRPTLDAVRVLLLVVPLMEEATFLEKSAMHEAALSHTRLLCTLRPWSASALPSPMTEESALHARIFVYAQIQEGISTALKGGHLFFHSEDIDSLRKMIGLSIDHALPSPISPTSTYSSGAAIGNYLDDARALIMSNKEFVQLTAMPLRLSSVCHRVHDVLTGFKAARRVQEHGLIDANGMHEIWQDLEQCWHGFVAMKNNVTSGSGTVNVVEHLVDAWLIFIFECYNIILEHLKRLALAAEPTENLTRVLFPQATSRPSTSSPYLPPHQLYLEAKLRCTRLLPHVLRIIRYHLIQRGTSGDAPNLFKWDTGLVRGGCLFAGLLSADLHGHFQCLDGHEVKPEETDDCITPEDGVNLCLSALAQMRWVFTKAEECSATIRLALGDSKERCESQSPTHLHHPRSNTFQPTNSFTDHNNPCSPYPEKYLHPFLQCSNPNITSGTHGRRAPPTLNLTLRSPRRVESAPNTACSTDGTGSNGWPTYTPPATASTAPILSSRGSPDFTAPYKSGHDEAIFYYMPETHDHFAYTVTTPQTSSTPVVPETVYQPRDAFYDTHVMHCAPIETTPECFGSNLFAPSETSLPSTGDDDNYVDMPVIL